MTSKPRLKSGPHGAAALGAPSYPEPDLAQSPPNPPRRFEREPEFSCQIAGCGYTIEVERDVADALGSGRWWRLTPEDGIVRSALMIGEPDDCSRAGLTAEAAALPPGDPHAGLWCSCVPFLARDGLYTCDHIRTLTALGLLRPLTASANGNGGNRRGSTEAREGSGADDGPAMPIPPTSSADTSTGVRPLPGQGALPFASDPAVASPVLPPVLGPYRSDAAAQASPARSRSRRPRSDAKKGGAR